MTALVLDNLGLAYARANIYLRSFGAYESVDAEDLRQAAVEGLCRAARRFDPSRGGFSGYATRYVIASIQMYLCRDAKLRNWKREILPRPLHLDAPRGDEPDSEDMWGLVPSREPTPAEWFEIREETRAALTVLADDPNADLDTCPNGHPQTDENRRWRKRRYGGWECLPCNAERKRARRQLAVAA